MIRIITFLLALGSSLELAAHCNNADAAKRRRKALASAKTTIASPLLNNYDVTHVRIDLALDNRNTDLDGNCLTTGRVVSPGGMTQYAFELNRKLSVDSVYFNGAAATATMAVNDLYVVRLPAAVDSGDDFRVQVWYHGTSGNGTGFFTHGLNHYSLPSGTNITFSLSDQLLAKDWWPCKQSLVDKIDSAELWFTVADSLKAGSNGVLQRVTPLTGNRNRYEWKTRYPTAYYLLSVAVAPYRAYQQTMRFSGSSDTMPVLHYVYDTLNFDTRFRPALDSTGLIVDHFSTLFGRYPFWQEKYGHCIAPLSGGMEHQTMTTLGPVTTTLIAHELGHQWWGDHVTYGSWRDIWLSEGFASYCEQLFVEHFKGKAVAQAYRGDVYLRVLGGLGGSVSVDDTDNVYRIFDTRLTYDKGAAVAHMLRYVAPNDAAYFAGLRTYQQRYAFGLATTDSLKAIMETAYGYRLDSFFRQWIYGEGFPVYSVGWNQSGNAVFVHLSQTTSRPGSVAAFVLPVPLRLQAGTRDTIVYANLSTADSVFSFRWDGIVTGLQIDPENQIVNRQGIISEESGLSVGHSNSGGAPIVVPNPTEGTWFARGLRPGQRLQLLDVSGRAVLELAADSNGQALIDSSRLAPGVYTLSSTDGTHFTRKLQKR